LIIYYLDILFKLELQESYAAATNYLNVQPHTATDTVRMLIKHDDLISHNHMWSSSTHVIGNDEGLHGILDDWQNAMQSGEEVDLSTGSIEFFFNMHLLELMFLKQHVLVHVKFVKFIQVMHMQLVKIKCIIVFQLMIFLKKIKHY
jgi:hypothetical protein